MSVKVTITRGDAETGIENGLIEGLTKVAIKMTAQAKALCPVDTGQLRNSIDYSVDGKEAIVGTNVEHAAPVEFGTFKQAAQPYLRPAVYIVANPGAGKIVGDALNIEMRKTLKNKRRIK